MEGGSCAESRLRHNPRMKPHPLVAVLALGYNDREAAAALKALPPDVAVSEGIKLALRALAK